jgi:hypothetical protein
MSLKLHTQNLLEAMNALHSQIYTSQNSYNSWNEWVQYSSQVPEESFNRVEHTALKNITGHKNILISYLKKEIEEKGDLLTSALNAYPFFKNLPVKVFSNRTSVSLYIGKFAVGSYTQEEPNKNNTLFIDAIITSMEYLDTLLKEIIPFTQGEFQDWSVEYKEWNDICFINARSAAEALFIANILINPFDLDVQDKFEDPKRVNETSLTLNELASLSQNVKSKGQIISKDDLWMFQF